MTEKRDNLMDVNCRICGDGPEGKITAAEAVEYAGKHGQEAHDMPTVGLNFNQRTSELPPDTIRTLNGGQE
jgi:hypothetical protein